MSNGKIYFALVILFATFLAKCDLNGRKTGKYDWDIGNVFNTYSIFKFESNLFTFFDTFRSNQCDLVCNLKIPRDISVFFMKLQNCQM